MLKFSIIIPVYNRPKELSELLETLTKQGYPNFEVIVVEDGSTQSSEQVVNEFANKFPLRYYSKTNTGPGDSRNIGATMATGDYLIFFDSDCLIPSNYLEQVSEYLKVDPLDIFGGPDKAHESFSNIQKAINYSMTSFLTTGGIRGHRRAKKNFQPRSFNMGVSTTAFQDIGGFVDIHPGEDPDLVYRLLKKGYRKGFLPKAFIYHKRRIDLNKFGQQVYKFGVVRAILMKWHPASRKFVFVVPTLVTLLLFLLLLFAMIVPNVWLVLLFGMLIILLDALRCTGNLWIAILGLVATLFQFTCYGWGFLLGWWQLYLRKRSERQVFPKVFLGPSMEKQ